METFDQISTEITNFFTSLLGKVDPAVKGTDPKLLKDLCQFTLPPEKVNALVKDVTKEVFFSQGNDKSPGPDGFSPFFFKKTWTIIESDIIVAISQFFKDLYLLPAFNATVIALIPKIPKPSKIKDFRPISCCSIFYKAISKILVKRLTCIMPELVTLNQTTFVKGRNITENTLLAQELVRGYNRNNISPRCSLKIDLHKAFDSLNWSFISTILQAIGLPTTFISWIETCYTTSSYSISINGSLSGFFKGARGLRQGDPLSPILFVLSMNVLSILLNLAAAKDIFGYHPKCKRINLTHLSFADDLLIFCKGSADSVIGVTSVLDIFYEMSGLQINAYKSEFHAAGMSSGTIETIKQATGFKLGYFPVRYLGIPLLTRKIYEKDCVILIDNIKSRLHHWSSKLLSYAGRLELIRTLCSHYFWKGSDKSATGARVSWSKICSLKSEGGLGIKDIKTWNKACMLALIKQILAGEGSLWVAWLYNYVFKNNDFWSIEAKLNTSWCLKRLLKLRPEVQNFLHPGPVNASSIWDSIRSKNQKVPWHKLVWFSLHIPKHSMITWMALLDRLPTKDRLHRIGLTNDCSCLLCNSEVETRDHLFLLCPTAVSLWERIFSFSGLHFTGYLWEEFLEMASSNWKGKSLLSTVMKIALNALVYLLWEERNRRLYQGRTRPANELLKNIKSIVCLQLNGVVEVELSPGPASFILLGVDDTIEVSDLSKPFMILILTLPLLGGRVWFCFFVGLEAMNSICFDRWGCKTEEYTNENTDYEVSLLTQKKKVLFSSVLSRKKKYRESLLFDDRSVLEDRMIGVKLAYMKRAKPLCGSKLQFLTWGPSLRFMLSWILTC
ncbi:uncharacterized protein LOC120214662 [Hibiscus syriacus]|uniref:uncharacterized protein LOC120214662 n=1 Tax=Hibiscus syriacus TaxID=106335 RepID=UPI001921EBAE|nr:uncharacterized protein LOC120214662 [Hibiscus syriacus]